MVTASHTGVPPYTSAPMVSPAIKRGGSIQSGAPSQRSHGGTIQGTPSPHYTAVPTPATRGAPAPPPVPPQTSPSPATPDLDEELDVEQRVAGGGQPRSQHHEQPLGALSPGRCRRSRVRLRRRPPRDTTRGRPRRRGHQRRRRHGPAAATAPARPAVRHCVAAQGGTIA